MFARVRICTLHDERLDLRPVRTRLVGRVKRVPAFTYSATLLFKRLADLGVPLKRYYIMASQVLTIVLCLMVTFRESSCTQGLSSVVFSELWICFLRLERLLPAQPYTDLLQSED